MNDSLRETDQTKENKRDNLHYTSLNKPPSESPRENTHYSINTDEVESSLKIDSNDKQDKENYSQDKNPQILCQDAKSTTEKGLEINWERIEPYMNKLLTEKFIEQDEVNLSRISNIMKDFSLENQKY